MSDAPSRQEDTPATGGGVWLRRGAWAAAVLAPLALLAAAWHPLTTHLLLGSMPVLDLHDIEVYFRESAWVVGGGSLYGSIPSEYPLAANLVFAAVRVASLPLTLLLTPATAYSVTWIAISLVVFVASVAYTTRVTGRRTAALWLTPAVILFSLIRFDLYPTMAVFLALLAARDGRPLRSAAWLGVGIALKGFALYALPAFLVWVWLQHGRRQTLRAGVLAIAPFAASLLVVLALGGLDAMLMPLRFQAARLPNGQGTWDVLHWILGFDTAAWIRRHGYVVQLLALGGALLAAATRPRTAEDLARAFVIGIGAFVTASVFYSPQYVLWFVPEAAVADGLWLFGSVVALGWATAVYFPIVYASRSLRTAYRGSVVLVTVLRTLAIVASLPWALPGDRRRGPAEQPPGAESRPS